MTLVSVVPLLVDSSIMQRRMLEHILNVAIHSIVEWISWGVPLQIMWISLTIPCDSSVSEMYCNISLMYIILTQNI